MANRVPTGFGPRSNLRAKAWLTTATRDVPAASESEMGRPASSPIPSVRK